MIESPAITIAFLGYKSWLLLASFEKLFLVAWNSSFFFFFTSSNWSCNDRFSFLFWGGSSTSTLFKITSCTNCSLRGSNFSMEVGLFKSELLAESTTKLGIGLVTGCDFAAASSFVISNKVLIRSFFCISFFSNSISFRWTAKEFSVHSWSECYSLIWSLMVPVILPCNSLIIASLSFLDLSSLLIVSVNISVWMILLEGLWSREAEKLGGSRYKWGRILCHRKRVCNGWI